VSPESTHSVQVREAATPGRDCSRSLKDLSRDDPHTADAAARHLDTGAVQRRDRGTCWTGPRSWPVGGLWIPSMCSGRRGPTT